MAAERSEQPHSEILKPLNGPNRPRLLGISVKEEDIPRLSDGSVVKIDVHVGIIDDDVEKNHVHVGKIGIHVGIT